MAQRLEAFIARTEVLRRFARHIADFRMLALPQGLSLGPMPEALRPTNVDDEGTPGAWTLPDAIARAAAEVSRGGIVGWVETTPGWEGAVIWRDGVQSTPSDRNLLLRELGVIRSSVGRPPSLRSRFQLLGLRPSALASLVPTVPRDEHGWFARLLLRPPPPRPVSEWRTLGLDGWLTESAYDVAERVESAATDTLTLL